MAIIGAPKIPENNPDKNAEAKIHEAKAGENVLS
jgi:hypothetical protein